MRNLIEPECNIQYNILIFVFILENAFPVSESTIRMCERYNFFVFDMNFFFGFLMLITNFSTIFF